MRLAGAFFQRRTTVSDMKKIQLLGLVTGAVSLIGIALSPLVAKAQESLPWQTQALRSYAERGADDTYRPGATYGNAQRYSADSYDSRTESYVPPANSTRSGGDVYRPGESYRADDEVRSGDSYQPDHRSQPPSDYGYGAPYRAPKPRATAPEPYERNYGAPRRAPPGPVQPEYYEQGEIVTAGHSFFGSISQGLARAVEYAFSRQGRPNGYILGEDAGGAFIVGLRYGEGRMHTKDAGTHRIYWQGPSIGYDAGAEGSKTMVLVYNMRDISDIYHRFGGVQGSFYVIGGVSVQFQKYGDVTLAVIRSGVGLRVGVNIGYLKYTRSPTWNPL